MKSSSVSKGGVMIPKKLQQDYGDSSDQIQYILEQGRKIDEILTYLQAKEEASNYKIVSFDPVGETVPEASKGERIGEASYSMDKNIRFVGKLEVADNPPESKGECSKCGCEYPIHKGDCPELYPPEHEESDGEFYGIHQSAGSWYREFENGKGRPLKIQDLKELFVSKEKIKRELGEMEVPPENLHASCEENTRYFDWVNQGHAGYLDKNSMRQKLIKSLGLGD